MFDEVFPTANIVELDEWYRVVATYDLNPEKPDFGNDSDLPVFTIEYRGSYKVEPLNEKAKEYADSIQRALYHWGRDEPRLERYLKAYHGATKLDWHSTRDANYYTFDPADVIDQYYKEGAEHRQAAIATTLELWGAYVDGDVYSIALERKLVGQKVYDGNERDPEEFEEWDVEESVGGYYGDNEITDEALRQWALDNTSWRPVD